MIQQLLVERSVLVWVTCGRQLRVELWELYTPTLNRRGATVDYLPRVEIEAFLPLIPFNSVYSEQIDVLLCIKVQYQTKRRFSM